MEWKKDAKFIVLMDGSVTIPKVDDVKDFKSDKIKEVSRQ